MIIVIERVHSYKLLGIVKIQYNLKRHARHLAVSIF